MYHIYPAPTLEENCCWSWATRTPDCYPWWGGSHFFCHFSLISLSLHGCCIMRVYYMCDLLGKSEPVSEVDIEDIRTPTPVSLDIEDIRTPTPVSLDIEDFMPPGVGQMPQGKETWEAWPAVTHCFCSHSCFEHVHSIVNSLLFGVNSKEVSSPVTAWLLYYACVLYVCPFRKIGTS